MKCHIPAGNRLSHRQKSIIREYDLSIQNENFRRYMKLAIAALHDKFGFGSRRAVEFLREISKLTQEADKDEVFWNHCDDVVIGELKLPFSREDYEEVDK